MGEAAGEAISNYPIGGLDPLQFTENCTVTKMHYYLMISLPDIISNSTAQSLQRQFPLSVAEEAPHSTLKGGWGQLNGGVFHGSTLCTK